MSMGFSRQEYWSGLPFPSAGDLPDPGIEPRSPELQVDFSPSESPSKSTLWCTTAYLSVLKTLDMGSNLNGNALNVCNGN